MSRRRASAAACACPASPIPISRPARLPGRAPSRCRRRRSPGTREPGPNGGSRPRAPANPGPRLPYFHARELVSSAQAYTTLSEPSRPMLSAVLHLPDAAATEAAGARLAAELRGGMVISLSGDLGAGKTTLARGCLRALGWRESVKSPTYTLVEHYPFSRLYFY